MLDIKTVKLKTEEEIIASWKDKEKTVVSVVCATFNHELYIEDAITGFLMQETDFAFEVIIHDDASTDKTADIVREYQSKYPTIIKPIYQAENQYSKGFRSGFLATEKTQGIFLSFCEGDDYWIDPSKLAKQAKILFKKINIDLVFHPALTLLDQVVNDLEYGFYGNKESIFNVSKVIDVSGGFMPMASIFIRRDSLMKYQALDDHFMRHLLRHSAIQIFGAIRGGAYYLPDVMSVYRSMHEGSWSLAEIQNSQAKSLNFIEFSQRNEKLNILTNEKFSKNFEELFERRLRTFTLKNKLNIKMSFILYCYLLKNVKLSLKSKVKAGVYLLVSLVIN